MTPAFNHLMMSLITRLSPIRCSRNRTIQSLETVSKNARMSHSTTQLILRSVDSDLKGIERIVRAHARAETRS